jgi:hypothetical protein
VLTPCFPRSGNAEGIAAALADLYVLYKDRLLGSMGPSDDFMKMFAAPRLRENLFRGSLKLDPRGVWARRVQKVEVFGPGRDGRIEVWRIELG